MTVGVNSPYNMSVGVGRLSAELHAAFHAGATFNKKTSRSTHMRLRHPSEIADGGTCEQCGETFLSSMGLLRVLDVARCVRTNRIC
ncbi:hypothetical protein MSG28_016114 [Choristoneura fumiferana]|uniref:Uncharacterized protein n=1 Tax=Choristoneura fumiferana TaxID=7141 RepID=A0ACC0K5V1_CHOFU|nr:hypothetical protein MSG28_016114 [Choristoneura fumiferana]